MTSKHSGSCSSGTGHRTIVLVVTVPEEHYVAARETLKIVRSGLAHGHETDEPDRACSYFGPFEVEGADQVLAYALGSELEGLYDPEEPSYAREHAIVAGVRALVAAAS